MPATRRSRSSLRPGASVSGNANGHETAVVVTVVTFVMVVVVVVAVPGAGAGAALPDGAVARDSGRGVVALRRAGKRQLIIGPGQCLPAVTAAPPLPPWAENTITRTPHATGGTTARPVGAIRRQTGGAARGHGSGAARSAPRPARLRTGSLAGSLAHGLVLALNSAVQEAG
mmetsp:Transcript_3120/g.12861  ORF Transcript_3120/g.12861 Transcript_3120/m.12861 type:complete len:172 (+) Transcript_3120:1330-1845(+)